METPLDVLFESLDIALSFGLITPEQYNEALKILNELKG